MSYQGWAILNIEGVMVAGKVTEAEGFGVKLLQLEVPGRGVELHNGNRIIWLKPCTEAQALAATAANRALTQALALSAVTQEPEAEPETPKPARGKKAKAPEPEAPKAEEPAVQEPEPEPETAEHVPADDEPEFVEVQPEDEVEPQVADDVVDWLTQTLPTLSSFAEVGKALPGLYALDSFAARTETSKSEARAEVWRHIKDNIDPGFDPLSHPVAFNLYMHTLFDPDRVQEAFEAFQGSEIWPRMPDGHKDALRGYVGARIAQLSQQQEAA